MIKKGFSYLGTFFLYVLSLMPLPLLYFFSTLLYYMVYYIIGYRKKVVRENLKNSFPSKTSTELLQIEKKFFRYLCDLIFEIIKMATISKRQLKRRFNFTNLHHIEKYHKQGISTIACTGHYGNWEWGIFSLNLFFKADTFVIYKPLNNKIFENWFYRMRSRFGNKLVVMRQTLRVLVANKDTPNIFCFAGDQTPIKEEAHYWINFLNQPTAVILGMEKIAIQTNRPVFYFHIKLLKRGHYEIDCIPLCTEPQQSKGHEITDKQFKLLEDIINEQPAYWLWSHRRWKHKPDAVKRERI